MPARAGIVGIERNGTVDLIRPAAEHHHDVAGHILVDRSNRLPGLLDCGKGFVLGAGVGVAAGLDFRRPTRFLELSDHPILNLLVGAAARDARTEIYLVVHILPRRPSHRKFSRPPWHWEQPPWMQVGLWEELRLWVLVEIAGRRQANPGEDYDRQKSWSWYAKSSEFFAAASRQQKTHEISYKERGENYCSWDA